MLNDLCIQHDERLRAMFDQWLEEMRRKSPAELLDDAETIFFKLNDFSDAANRSDAQKAAAAANDDLDLGAHMCCSFDFNPDSNQLRDVVGTVAGNELGRGTYPRDPLPPEFLDMENAVLLEELLEQLMKEFEDSVLGGFSEVDGVEAVFQAESCHNLSLFYEEVRDWLPQAGLSIEEIRRLLEFERPLDVLFTEYEGCGIDEYMCRSSFDDLKEVFPFARATAPNLVMEPPF